jgi:hypothetical protein
METIYAGPDVDPLTYVPKERQAKFDSLGQQIAAAEAELDQLQGQKAGEFPVLSAYLARGLDKTAALTDIAAGPERGEGLNSLTEVVNDRLDNIAKVRGALDDGKVNVWKSPVIFGRTKRQLGIAPATWQDRAVEDRRARGAPLGL